MPLPTMPAKPAQLLDPSEFAPVTAVPKVKAVAQGKKPVPALERVALLETGETQAPDVKARAAGSTRARSTLLQPNRPRRSQQPQSAWSNPGPARHAARARRKARASCSCLTPTC